MRWMLYLLRSPIWDLLTGKLLEKAKKFPIPGGRWVVQYIMQWVLYIQNYHFMLESAVG